MYKKILLLIFMVVIVYVILVYAKNILIYHPTTGLPIKYERFFQKLAQLTDSPNQIINCVVKTSDNINLDTVYIKNSFTKKCIIFFHGNAGNISMRFDMIKFLYNFASVIIFDYRSFGNSSGDSSNLSAFTLQKDANAIWSYAVNQLGIDAKNISLFGESLGCAIAIELVANLSRSMDEHLYPHSLILNSPFYSLGSMIELTFSRFNINFIGQVVSMILGNEYKSNDFIKFINHKTRIIIAHSPRDEVVPYREGLKLYQSIMHSHPNIKFINITGTHNNLGLTDSYIYTIADLFDD